MLRRHVLIFHVFFIKLSIRYDIIDPIEEFKLRKLMFILLMCLGSRVELDLLIVLVGSVYHVALLFYDTFELRLHISVDIRMRIVF